MEKRPKLIIFLLATLLVTQNYLNWSVSRGQHHVYQIWLDNDIVHNQSQTVPKRLNFSNPVFLVLDSKSVSEERTKLHQAASAKVSIEDATTNDTWKTQSTRPWITFTRTTQTAIKGTTFRQVTPRPMKISADLSSARNQEIPMKPLPLQMGNRKIKIPEASAISKDLDLDQPNNIFETASIPTNPFPRQDHQQNNNYGLSKILSKSSFLPEGGQAGDDTVLRSLAAVSGSIPQLFKTARDKLLAVGQTIENGGSSSMNTGISFINRLIKKVVWEGVRPAFSSHLVNNIRKLKMKNAHSLRAIVSLEDRLNKTINSIATAAPPCPSVPPSLVGRIRPALGALPLEWIEKTHPEVEPGGRWRPKLCVANHRVAIIVPYRDRPNQLVVFLRHLHPFLQKQQLDYAIYVVELAQPTTFNRGLLLNAGFEEARKLHHYQCYVFHDVDLLPEDDRNIYSCPERDRPRHLSVAISSFKYRLPYSSIFGGACAVTSEQFFKVNGFPNRYFGWGAEDDDLSNRLSNNGFRISRYPAKVGRYKMISHKQQDRNPKRFRLLDENVINWRYDGLSTLKYQLLKLELRPLYTWVFISVDEQETMKLGQPFKLKRTKTT